MDDSLAPQWFNSFVENKWNHLSQQVNSLDKKVDSIEGHVNSLDKKVDSIEEQVNSLDKKVDIIEGQVSAYSNRVNSINSKLGRIESEIGSLFESTIRNYIIKYYGENFSKSYVYRSLFDLFWFVKNSDVTEKYKEKSVYVALLSNEVKNNFSYFLTFLFVSIVKKVKEHEKDELMKLNEIAMEKKDKIYERHEIIKLEEFKLLLTDPKELIYFFHNIKNKFGYFLGAHYKEVITKVSFSLKNIDNPLEAFGDCKGAGFCCFCWVSSIKFKNELNQELLLELEVDCRGSVEFIKGPDSNQVFVKIGEIKKNEKNFEYAKYQTKRILFLYALALYYSKKIETFVGQAFIFTRNPKNYNNDSNENELTNDFNSVHPEGENDSIFSQLKVSVSTIQISC